MPAGPRPRRDPTDDWDQLRLLVVSSAQETYELLRPIVLFGQPIPARARETLETSRQTVYEVLRRWDEEGWPGLADRPLGPRHPARKVDLRRWRRSGGCRPTPNSASSASTPPSLSKVST